VAVHIVMRGYGGRMAGPLRVDPAQHDARAVGDEALLAAARTAAWVARDRSAGVRAAVAAGAGAILLDDGFQNPTVAKDLSLLVVDAGYGFGNGRLLPAGPLREPLAAGLARADAVVLIGDGAATPHPLGLIDRPVLRAALAPLDAAPLVGPPLVAFAGIGRPAKFFATLDRLGAAVAVARGFPDHHVYRPGELAALRETARRHGARLVTTAKDWVRLPPAERRDVAVLEVALRWADEAALDAVLAPLLGRIDDGGRRITA
ncbi:MAG TPA: tetraacyldisaccharide 4'-kinase, partial [Stellaceae bacterium]|nr:tetraacyldisaccharide 4'-kinase [Stellaceae bacterium]